MRNSEKFKDKPISKKWIFYHTTCPSINKYSKTLLRSAKTQSRQKAKTNRCPNSSYLYRLRLVILMKLLLGKKIELVIDGTIVDIANVNRARTQNILRLSGGVWWVKRYRKIRRRDNGQVVEFEEVRYGMLMMVLCGREGVVYELKMKRQVVEGVISQIKLFNAGSGWRTLICVLVYAYAIGYSFYRRFV